MKKILVKYTIHYGGYEFSGHAVLDCEHARDCTEPEIIKFFMSFYDNGNAIRDENYNSFSYFDGEIAIDDIRIKIISSAESKLLESLGL